MVEKLNNGEIIKEYKDELENKLVSVNIDELSYNKGYTQITKIISSTAQHILGKYRAKKQLWITDNILNMCDIRRSLKTTKYQIEENDGEYRRIHNIIRSSMK